MVPKCAGWWCETENRATTSFGYCSGTVSVRPHRTNVRRIRCQEDLNSFPLGELEEIIIRGWRLLSRTWNHWISRWKKQLTWLRIIHSGEWCLRLALCTHSGACQKWMSELAVLIRDFVVSFCMSDVVVSSCSVFKHFTIVDDMWEVEADLMWICDYCWLQQLIACSLLSSLLSEYSNGTRTSRVGLTWEQHCSCKIAFEVCCIVVGLHLYVAKTVIFSRVLMMETGNY